MSKKNSVGNDSQEAAIFEAAKQEAAKQEAAKQEASRQKHTIYSTATNNLNIHIYAEDSGRKSNAAKRVSRVISIKGGNGVNYPDGKRGVMLREMGETVVTGEELELLRETKIFQRREKNGFLTVDVAPKNAKLDKSAQMTREELKILAPDVKTEEEIEKEKNS